MRFLLGVGFFHKEDYKLEQIVGYSCKIDYKVALFTLLGLKVNTAIIITSLELLSSDQSLTFFFSLFLVVYTEAEEKSTIVLCPTFHNSCCHCCVSTSKKAMKQILFPLAKESRCFSCGWSALVLSDLFSFFPLCFCYIFYKIKLSGLEWFFFLGSHRQCL